MVGFNRCITSTLLASVALVAVSYAQSSVVGLASSITSPPTSASAQETASSTRTPVTHTVDVGDAGNHRFKPDLITALEGDTVEFLFGPTNHSVVRAEYEYPCVPYEMTGRGKQGFWSGFHAVDTYDDRETWSLKINDTNPIFFYCSAPESCITWKMVGVINPNGSVSLQRQKQLAGEADYMLSPGEPFPAEASSTMASLTADPTAGPTGGNAGSNGGGNSDSGKHGLSAGAIAGIAVAGVVILLLAAGLFFFMGRSKGYKFALRRSHATVGASNQGGGYMAPPGNPDMFHLGYGHDPHSSMEPRSPPPPFHAAMYKQPDPHMHIVGGEMDTPQPPQRDTFSSGMFTEHIGLASERYSVASERKNTPAPTQSVHEMYVPPTSPPLSPPLPLEQPKGPGPQV